MKPIAQRRLIIRLLLCASMGFLVSAAAEEKVTKIGYVDMKRLLDNAPQVVMGRQKLEHEFASQDIMLKADEAQLNQLRDQYSRNAAFMSKPETEALKNKIDALDRSIKRNHENLRSELKTRSDQELDKRWREISNAVVEFARDKGYDLIVPSPVVYASQRIDITDQVLEKLKHDYQNKEVAP